MYILYHDMTFHIRKSETHLLMLYRFLEFSTNAVFQYRLRTFPIAQRVNFRVCKIVEDFRISYRVH